jgi:hypothetical protein
MGPRIRSMRNEMNSSYFVHRKFTKRLLWMLNSYGINMHRKKFIWNGVHNSHQPNIGIGKFPV